jgi:hypothetical protein
MAIKNRLKILIAEKEVKENRKLTLRIISEEAGVSTNSLTAYNNQDVVRFDAPVLEAFSNTSTLGWGIFSTTKPKRSIYRQKRG